MTLDADCDFTAIFNGEKDADAGHRTDKPSGSPPQKSEQNKHGIDIIQAGRTPSEARLDDECFEQLLEESFKANRPTGRIERKPVPVQKRIKRYPPVEKELDLHGLTAVKARERARSFIETCQQQGFFTIRLIVGKGRHSQMGPVLPDVIEDLAAGLKRQSRLIWFEWENKSKINSGALIVYLNQYD